MKRIVSFIVFSLLYSCNSYVESYECLIPRDRTKVRIAQWNIGHFDFGDTQNSRIGPINYSRELQKYKDVLDIINADVLAVCEYSELFGESETGKQYSREVLFYSYPFKYEGHQNYYACNALFSRVYLQNVQSNSFSSLKTNYYYLSAEMPVGERIISIVSTHLAFNKSDDEYALVQIKELLSKYEDQEYVIMMGDWNLKDVDIFNLFIDAGYQLANHGVFGDFATVTDKKNARNRVLDNIMIKGMSITDVSVISKELSDHYPIIVTVQLFDEVDFLESSSSTEGLKQ